jgi:hypothetical protein
MCRCRDAFLFVFQLTVSISSKGAERSFLMLSIPVSEYARAVIIFLYYCTNLCCRMFVLFTVSTKLN